MSSGSAARARRVSACAAASLALGCALEPELPPPSGEMVAAADLDPDPGVVEVSLVAEPALHRYRDGEPTAVWAYRDAGNPGGRATVPGPFIAADVGQRLIVHFENRLPEATTVHFHGPRVPNAMDGAPMGGGLVLPGGTFTYDFELLDAATFWYHPHWITDLQIERGLYGQLAVSGAVVEAVVERFFMLDDVDLREDNSVDEEPSAADLLAGRHGEVILVNGTPAPRYSARRGERERWHFTNASNGRYFELELAGHSLTVIGSDGGLLEEARAVSRLRIAPGKRFDVVVTLAGEEGSELALVTHPVDRGLDELGGDRTRTVLTLAFAGQAAPVLPLEQVLPEAAFEPIFVDAATPRERIELGADLDPLVGTEPEYFINDQRWPFADALPGPLGAVRVWDIVNRTPSPEPFHLHGTFMQALALDGEPLLERSREDVVDVPPGSTLSVAVRYERPGEWMFHSNIPEHAEAGMMRMLHLGH
jgi:FtsP/CotA-like multicopper oxidase with cupredoxin domain